MQRALRFLAFVVGISALGGLTGLTIARFSEHAQGPLLAQVSGRAMFSRGGVISVQANTQTFTFCNPSSRPVPIAIPQGTLQVYEFAGYEWALAITQPGAPSSTLFPGKSTTIVNGKAQDNSTLTQIQPDKLYFITSSVPLTIDCSAGTMNGSGAGEGNGFVCPMVSCATPPKDCAWSTSTDANGCQTCGKLVCVPGSTTGTTGKASASCPSGYGCLINGSTSPLDGPRVAWECGYGTNAHTEYGQSCGTSPNQGVCVRCVQDSQGGTTGSTSTSCPSGYGCLIRGSISPPDSASRVAWECNAAGYHSEQGQSCGSSEDQGVCVRCVQDSQGSTGGTQCTMPSCAVPRQGCYWTGGKDANGCPTCGRMVCT